MALRNRPYRWYFFSGMGMTAGQGIQQLALAWLILELTDSVGQLGLSIFLRGVPMALLGLVGGVLADRYNRRRLLITNQLLTMLNLFILSALVIGDLAEVWHVYLSSILLGATMALTAPARQAMIRGLVDREEMMNAVALNSMQMNSSRIIWPTLAGGLIVFTGSGGALLLCGICYLFGALFMLPVPDVSGGKTTAKTSPIAEVVEGFRFTFSHSLIGMVMILVVSMGSFGLAFTFIAPAFAKQVLDFGPGEAGLFLMASGIGALLGSAALLVFEAKNRTLILVLLSLGFASSLIAISLNSNYGFCLLAHGYPRSLQHHPCCRRSNHLPAHGSSAVPRTRHELLHAWPRIGLPRQPAPGSHRRRIRLALRRWWRGANPALHQHHLGRHPPAQPAGPLSGNHRRWRRRSAETSLPVM